MKWHSVADFLEFARKYRIAIEPKNRIWGILFTFFGWALVAVATIAFQVPFNAIALSTSFVLQFVYGAAAIFVGCLLYGLCSGKGLKGYRFLSISSGNERSGVSHLTARQRIWLIYSRGVLGAVGYVAYGLAKLSIGAVNNSVLYGADALMYAVLVFFLLKETFTRREVAGIVICASGVFVVLVFDLLAGHFLLGLFGWLTGIFSSISLAVILILTSVIIQHDHPVRVAFHQCICGVAIAGVASVILGYQIGQLDFSLAFSLRALIAGLSYAGALVLLFAAFLYVEPVLIAALSYSLLFCIVVFLLITGGYVFSLVNVISEGLIIIGVGVLVFAEYQKDKKHRVQ